MVVQNLQKKRQSAGERAVGWDGWAQLVGLTGLTMVISSMAVERPRPVAAAALCVRSVLAPGPRVALRLGRHASILMARLFCWSRWKAVQRLVAIRAISGD